MEWNNIKHHPSNIKHLLSNIIHLIHISHLPSAISHLNDIRQYLRGHWHLEHPTDLQKKEKTDRNEILIEAIQYGAPLRQLSD